jgi:hypothetical protein
MSKVIEKIDEALKSKRKIPRDFSGTRHSNMTPSKAKANLEKARKLIEDAHKSFAKTAGTIGGAYEAVAKELDGKVSVELATDNELMLMAAMNFSDQVRELELGLRGAFVQLRKGYGKEMKNITGKRKGTVP